MTNDSDIDKTLVWLTEHDAITLRKFYEGNIVTGATGSGKTSRLFNVSEKPLSGKTNPSKSDGENP